MKEGLVLKSLRKRIGTGSALALGLWITLCSTAAFAQTLTPEEAVNMALEKHLDIKMAANSEKQAEYALKSAKGTNGVSIDASNTSYFKKTHSSDADNSTGLTLSLPLYSGGKNEANIAIADTELKMAALTLATVSAGVASPIVPMPLTAVWLPTLAFRL